VRHESRSTAAHDATDHPLAMAHTEAAAAHGLLVYVVCGWQGCPQRLEVDAAVWQAEPPRRAPPGAGGGGKAFPQASVRPCTQPPAWEAALGEGEAAG